LRPGLLLSLEPKVPIGNLFRLLEVAYDLKAGAFRVYEDLVGCGSLADFYERLANILAKRTLQRARWGFHREYVEREDLLPFVRGRLNAMRLLTTPWSVNLQCGFEEHTPEIDDNRVLAWTLNRVLRSRLCRERTLPTIRHAYRTVSSAAAPTPFSASDCVGRSYTRLNEDYKPLHALCRFFLEGTGPHVREGDHAMLPFLIDMSELFELFVANWLAEALHKPDLDLLVHPHRRHELGEGGMVTFDLDLMIQSRSGGRALCVLDTKYKRPDRPSNEDISQVVTYALLERCDQAVLVYPGPLAMPLDIRIGAVRVRSLTFDLGDELERAGQKFLVELLDSIGGHLLGSPVGREGFVGSTGRQS
jgi:5-methylcytosine-specific restriction enzyme subunit McrC